MVKISVPPDCDWDPSMNRGRPPKCLALVPREEALKMYEVCFRVAEHLSVERIVSEGRPNIEYAEGLCDFVEVLRGRKTLSHSNSAVIRFSAIVDLGFRKDEAVDWIGAVGELHTKSVEEIAANFSDTLRGRILRLLNEKIEELQATRARYFSR